jgi:signal transduction histidine kinase
MMTLALFVAAFAATIGFAVIWVNPGRFINQTFALLSLMIVAESLLIFQAFSASRQFLVDQVTSPVPWVKANAAINGFLPWILWLIKESVLTMGRQKLKTIGRSVPWGLIGIFSLVLVYMGPFIPEGSRPGDEKYGVAYTVRTVTLLAALLILVMSSWRQVGFLSGIRNVEMRFLALSGGIAAFVIVSLRSVGVFFQVPELRGLGAVAVLVGYAIMAWAMTVHRVFDVRQVFVSLGQRAIMVGLAVVGVVGLNHLFDDLVAPAVSIVLSFTICALVIFRLDRMFREWLGMGEERKLAAARAKIMEAASSEPDTRKLKVAFEAILSEHCQTSFAALVADTSDTHVVGLDLGSQRPGFLALCRHEWATPEGLERLRSSPELADLGGLLAKNSLGLVLTAPRGSKTPSLVLALGTKTNHWPYTYPEVQRLQSLAESMDNALTHSRLTAQAVLKARIEDLAVVSRGLAHDLKNLITPISTFLVHTDGRFRPGSAEGQVHEAAKRSIQLMAEYMREAMFFSNRLEPRFEQVELRAILETMRESTKPHAAKRGVTVRVEIDADFWLVVDPALFQRLVINLVINAIDASTNGREVVVSATTLSHNSLQLRVADHGCGIPAELNGRIFEPYFTTKESGDDTRGYGLGLTICQKIVQLHEGTIQVESENGLGTNITVEIPLGRRPTQPSVPVKDLPEWRVAATERWQPT